MLFRGLQPQRWGSAGLRSDRAPRLRRFPSRSAPWTAGFAWWSSCTTFGWMARRGRTTLAWAG